MNALPNNATTNAPRFSVVLEGYNESQGLGHPVSTLAALAKQTVALSTVEVILVGNSAQAEAWRDLPSTYREFRRLEIITADEANYYALKNRGASAAQGEIIVLIDSDAVPADGWLAAVEESISRGADVAVGPTRFFSESDLPLPGWLLDVAASISWGFVVGKLGEAQVEVRGFLSHNVAFRAEVAHMAPFDEGYARTCAGSMLYGRMKQRGLTFRFNPKQGVAHSFSLGWWVLRLHARIGYEVFRLRRLDSPVVNRHAARLSLFEAPATMLWHVARDLPQWLRYAQVLGWSRAAAIAVIPVLLSLSLVARTSEMIGMYRARLAPKRMAEFALR